MTEDNGSKVKTDSNLLEKCKCSICEGFLKRQTPKTLIKTITKCKLQTNFGINVNNPFAENSKSSINIRIPEVCIFYKGQIYDMIYSTSHIKGSRTKDAQIFKKHQVFRFFKQHHRPGKQCLIACFYQNDYLLLSDGDLLNSFYKGSSDPLWENLSYIQNRIPTDNYRYIKRLYTSELLKQSDISNLVVQSLLGILDEKNLQEKMTEDKYLDFLGLKICSFLNMNHNIRIIQCEFCYVKCTDGSYWLVDVLNLNFLNLTPLMKKMEQKILQEQSKVCQKLLITPKKQKVVKNYENSKAAKKIENQMNNIFQNEVRKVGFFSSELSKVEFSKNEQAFKTIHPNINMNYKNMIQSRKFRQLKDSVLQNNNRRPLYRVSNSDIYKFYVPRISMSLGSTDLHNCDSRTQKSVQRCGSSSKRIKSKYSKTLEYFKCRKRSFIQSVK